jgi:uncharacterized membrane protein YGL010W
MDTLPLDEEPRRIDQLLAHYSLSHQHPMNERIHFLAVPLIMLTLIGLMFEIHPAVAYVFLAASMVYYLRLSLVFSAVMAVWTALMLMVVFAMGEHRLLICVSVFVGAWVLQFIGHKLEGQKPSFFEDVQYLWVGPLFVLRPLLLRFKLTW